MQKIMLIDGNSIANRAYYGVPLLSNAEGRYTNAVYGFLNIMFKLMDEEKPDYLCVAFDLHTPTFRHIKFEEYKGTRKGMPEELREQMPLLKEVLTSMHIRQYEAEGFEADDILGTLSQKAEEEGMNVVVVSGDRDLLQLASETLKIKIPKTYRGQTTVEDYYAADVVEKYGVTPLEFIDLKALMGDASDNIPGVPGIGEKTATKIIQEFHNIETAIQNADKITPKKAANNIIEFEEKAHMSKFLATIERNMPLELRPEELTVTDMFNTKSYELFKRLEFKSLLTRFDLKGDTGADDRRDEYRYLKDKEEISRFLLSVKPCEISYVLLSENSVLAGMAVYCDQTGGVWLETGEGCSDGELAEAARRILEEDSFQKIGHDVKKDIHLLKKYGIHPGRVCFDTAIAAYLLNPTNDTYAYNDIAGEFLNRVLLSEEELLGKGKSKKSLWEMEEKARCRFAAQQAQTAFQAKGIMEEKLREYGQEVLYYDIELPLLYVLADMEFEGMKVDRAKLLEYQRELEVHLDYLTKEIYHMAGEEFNINSPKQLGVILFEKLGMKGGKKTKTGSYSTGADILEKLRLEHPIVEAILLYRQIAKLKSTYADGLLNVLDEKTDKIYSTFNQTITATGRISSTEPNLQNIPIRLELGRSLRKVFVPTSEDYVFLDGDYSQIELRVLAHMANDETLIDAFINGQDIHRLTASQVFNIPFDEVTAAQRSNAKAVNFGIVYGIGAFSLSQDLGITRKEAESYINSYFVKYPNIRKYMDKTIADAKENGYVTTLFSRRRYMPELNSNNFNMRSFGERVAMNMPIQGSAADIIKIAMVKVSKALREGGYRSRLILQVHDELLIEAHKEEAEAVAGLLKENMEHAVELSVPLEVDVHRGSTWFECK